LIDTQTGSDAVKATRMATGKPSGFAAVSLAEAGSGGRVVSVDTRMVPFSVTSAGLKSVFSDCAFGDSADSVGTLGLRLAGSATCGARAATRGEALSGAATAATWDIGWRLFCHRL